MSHCNKLICKLLLKLFLWQYLQTLIKVISLAVNSICLESYALVKSTHFIYLFAVIWDNKKNKKELKDVFQFYVMLNSIEDT